MVEVRPGEITEEHHRLVKRIVLGVRPGERRRAIDVIGTEHVVVGGQP